MNGLHRCLSAQVLEEGRYANGPGRQLFRYSDGVYQGSEVSAVDLHYVAGHVGESHSRFETVCRRREQGAGVDREPVGVLVMRPEGRRDEVLERGD